MGLTRGQLLDRIASPLGDTSTKFRTYLEGSFNHAMYALYDMHDWEWKHKLGTFSTVAGTESYDLSVNKLIYHGSVTGGPFVAGETITGGTSGATGRVNSVGPVFLNYTAVSGTLVISEVITGTTSTATATSTTAPLGGLAGVADIRSAQDIEIMYDTTNGRVLPKVDLKNIRKQYPKEDTSGQPRYYAPWGDKTVYLSDEPDATYIIKYLYTSKATSSSSDSDSIETVLGIPDYVQYLLEKMVMAEAMLYYDDARRTVILQEIGSAGSRGTLLFNAIAADMKHLESTARFKFWEEELCQNGLTYDQYLGRVWANV